MSRIEKCLGDAVDAGRLSRDQAEDLLRRFRREERQFAKTMGQTQAEAEAAAKVAAELAAEAAERKRQTALQILRLEDLKTKAESHPEGMVAGVAALMGRDVHDAASYGSVESRMVAIEKTLFAMWISGVEQFRSKMAGLRRNSLGLERLVRELYGENVGDDMSRAAAAQWREMTDYAVGRFNAAGGTLRRKEAWRLPQVWQREKIAGAGQQQFREYMMDALEQGRVTIRDFETGDPVDRAKAVEIISEAYDRIRTNGLSELMPGRHGATKLANSRSDPRVFEWTSADAWLDFNDRFGVGREGIMDLLTGHVRSIGRDIALLEAFGPNPEASARYMIDLARQWAGREGRSGLGGLGPGPAAKWLEAIWDQTTGKAHTPVSENVATFMRGLRGWATATKLGSALLSSVTDFATLRQTAKFNGLDTVKALGFYTRTLNPASEADRRLATKLGLTAETGLRTMHAASRHTLDVVGHELPSRIADTVLRASFLSTHTDAARQAFGMAFYSELADVADTAFTKLPEIFQQRMRRYGITPDDWNLIRTGDSLEQDGVRFLWPEALARQGGARAEAATKLMSMVLEETAFAVPTPGAVERAAILGSSRPGTISGEMLRTFGQFKTFSVAMVLTHGMRGLRQAKGGDYGQYLASIVLSMTVMGAWALQMKEIAKGREPRDMADSRFWGAAFVQGGGAGIFGDFLYAGLSRERRGLVETFLGGPSYGVLEDAWRLSAGNLMAEATGEDADWGRDFVRFLRYNTPGSSIWYARLALDRMLFDQLQTQLDPDYRASFRRLEQRYRREFDQEFYWEPGEALPN